MKEAGRLGCFTKIFFSFVADWTNTMQLTDTPGWVRGLKISTTRVHRTLVYLARLSLSLRRIHTACTLTDMDMCRCEHVLGFKPETF